MLKRPREAERRRDERKRTTRFDRPKCHTTIVSSATTMLVSFADRRFKRSAKRIAAQAGQFKVIDRIEILSEQDLDPAFVSRFRDVLKPNVRGFGYYCWKPQVILQSLRALDEGDVLIYVDAGAHLFAASEERLLEYIETCSASQSVVLAFQTTWPEASWTKGDLFDHFGVRHNPELTQRGQVNRTVSLRVRRYAT